MLTLFEWSTLYYVSEWVIRLVMVAVVTRRGQPAASVAWLLVIFFLPWPGLLMYLLIGETWLGRRKAARHERVLEAMARVDRMAITEGFAVVPEIAEQHQPLINLAQNMGALPILAGNSVEMLTDTDEVIDRLIDDVESAEHHVHLLFYIVRDDRTGRLVAEALARAQQRGVRCRVLYDAVGSRRTIGKLAHYLHEHGVECRPMLPVGVWRRLLSRMDLRNHRKLAVIDGRIAYAGSQNLVDADYGHKSLAWYDLTLRVVGPSALHVQVVYLSDRRLAVGEGLNEAHLLPAPQVAGEQAVHVVPSGPSSPNEDLQHLVVDAIHRARRRLVITTPYFVPSEPAMLALKSAVMRGAQVDVVVPKRGDHPLVAAASRAYYGELLDAGVRVHRFCDGLLHAKTMTVDDAFALVGSANFDIRSFNLNFELNLLLYGQQVTAELRFAQQSYIDRSEQVDPSAWRDRPYARRLPEDIAKLLSPLL